MNIPPSTPWTPHSLSLSSSAKRHGVSNVGVSWFTLYELCMCYNMPVSFPTSKWTINHPLIVWPTIYVWCVYCVAVMFLELLEPDRTTTLTYALKYGLDFGALALRFFFYSTLTEINKDMTNKIPPHTHVHSSGFHSMYYHSILYMY